MQPQEAGQGFACYVGLAANLSSCLTKHRCVWLSGACPGQGPSHTDPRREQHSVSSLPSSVFRERSQDTGAPVSPGQVVKGGRSLGKEEGTHFEGLSPGTERRSQGPAGDTLGDVPQARAPSSYTRSVPLCPSITPGPGSCFLSKLKGQVASAGEGHCWQPGFAPTNPSSSWEGDPRLSIPLSGLQAQHRPRRASCLLGRPQCRLLAPEGQL